MISYNTTTGELDQKWRECTACDLAKLRDEQGLKYISGFGCKRGIMFITDAGGKSDGELGEPAAPKSDTGFLLRNTLERLGLLPTHDYYITAALGCPSLELATDAGGREIMRKDYKTGLEALLYRDCAAKPAQVTACSPRILEEIYHIDPFLIVTLGQTATAAVLGKRFEGQNYTDRGSLITAKIPGNMAEPVLSEGRRLITREKLTKKMKLTPNLVSYSVMPTLPLHHVINRMADRGTNSPLKLLVEDLKKARSMWFSFLKEVHGVNREGDDGDDIEDALRTNEYSG